MHIQKKFWKHVEEALNKIDDSFTYYAGGTLSIYLGKDNTGKERGICLNITGKGFVLSDLKNTTLYMPDFITDKVREIYLKNKGETDYYKEVVKHNK